MRILLFLFVILPVVEIYTLIKVGSAIGAMSTIALILVTAFIGAGLLKRQGYATLARAREKMGQGALPAREMVEGIFLAVGGALLLTPGFITDGIGFCCLIPNLRHYFMSLGQKHMSSAQMNTHFRGPGPASGQPHRERAEDGRGGKNTIIDGEFKREE